MVWFHGLNAEEELGDIVEHSPGEGVVVFTSRVLQIVVPLIVEHLVRGKVHRRIEESEPRQEPSKTAEDEGLDETNDVEEPPPLDSNAVAGKEDGDGAVDGNREGEHQEPAPVSEPHTVVDVGAVMVELCHASVADPAVFGTQGSHRPTSVAQSQNIRA